MLSTTGKLSPGVIPVGTWIATSYSPASPGQRDQALPLIRPFEEKYPNVSVSMQWFAAVYAFMGDEPNTLKWLERSADRHEWSATPPCEIPPASKPS